MFAVKEKGNETSYVTRRPSPQIKPRRKKYLSKDCFIQRSILTIENDSKFIGRINSKLK
jgi:hypothetical protein